MGQDGSSNWKRWGTLNFETETDAEKAIHGVPDKQSKGCFLGAKLGEYSTLGARQDRRDVDMEQGTASSNGRPESAGRRSGSETGRQRVRRHEGSNCEGP
ncbi:hypothetical protein WJX82_000456 [Trebouxia sp. C0006]